MKPFSREKIFVKKELVIYRKKFKKYSEIMPKRPNPFGDSSPLQFKSHISVKEIDMGVAQESKMQTVYGEMSKCSRQESRSTVVWVNMY